MFKRISVNQAVELINQGEAQVVDVRDPNAFAQGHIEGASRVDNSNFGEYLQSANKQKPLLVVCYHGNSSQQAAEVFNQQGFEACYSMDGGMSDWAQTQVMVTSS